MTDRCSGTVSPQEAEEGFWKISPISRRMKGLPGWLARATSQLSFWLGSMNLGAGNEQRNASKIRIGSRKRMEQATIASGQKCPSDSSGRTLSSASPAVNIVRQLKNEIGLRKRNSASQRRWDGARNKNRRRQPIWEQDFDDLSSASSRQGGPGVPQRAEY